MLDVSLSRLSKAPAQFRSCVEDIARQISGVVAAIQAHDITRQQAEHVQRALERISTRLGGNANSESAAAQDLPQAYAGLTIQIYQLEAVKVTVESWTGQIKACMDGILRVSASEMLEMGSMVLAQEREVSLQLAHIERLEGESQAYSPQIRHTLEGLSSLMQFVGEHVQRSRSIRDRLRLLSFNSIIEANRFGRKAQAVLEIARTIKDISAEWSQITDRAGQAMDEILALVQQANQAMDAFSEASNDRLRGAQNQASASLNDLRAAAAFVDKQSREMETITSKIQSRSAGMSGTHRALDACSSRVDAILAQLESVRRELAADQPGVSEQYDAAEVERLFSESYTTETEREVLRAALHGRSLPAAQHALEGNSVELF